MLFSCSCAVAFTTPNCGPRHWPKRVGAVVDLLYSDTGRVRKKYDSSTEGRSVTISPSVKVGRCVESDACLFNCRVGQSIFMGIGTGIVSTVQFQWISQVKVQ